MTVTTNNMSKKYAGLKRFNLIMGFLHLVQGVFMILVSNDTTYPIFTNYLNCNVLAHLGRGTLLSGDHWLWTLCGKLEERHESGKVL